MAISDHLPAVMDIWAQVQITLLWQQLIENDESQAEGWVFTPHNAPCIVKLSIRFYQTKIVSLLEKYSNLDVSPLKNSNEIISKHLDTYLILKSFVYVIFGKTFCLKHLTIRQLAQNKACNEKLVPPRSCNCPDYSKAHKVLTRKS